MEDIILKDNDIRFQNGDFVIGNATNQNIEMIVESHKKEWKERPDIGFGANQYLKSNITPMEFKRKLKVELERDNIVDVSINFNNEGKLNIESN